LIELAAGVDALYLSGRAALPDHLLIRLEGCRDVARENGPQSFDLGSEEFELAGHGLHKFRYRLDHKYGCIGISPSESLPALRVQPRAEFIHAVGPRAVVQWFEEVIGAEVGPIRWTVSRIDLYADFQGWGLTGDDRTRFVTRADLRDTYEDGDELTGFVFGRRSTGTISARIYDKTREMRRSGAAYLVDQWGKEFDPDRPVLRVEFEIGRDYLREYGLDSPDEVLDAIGALWWTCTRSWLRYCSPTADMTRSRWPVTREWESVQRARVGESAIGLEKVRAGMLRGSLERTMPSLVGWMARFGAITSTDDLAPLLTRLHDEVRRYCEQTGASIPARVAEKRKDLGLL
jgi:hypothetical protein